MPTSTPRRCPKASTSSRRPRWDAATSPRFTRCCDQGQVKADENVVVYGCGGVGLSAIQIASALGARVIAVDLDDRKLELAKKVGASDVINGKKTDPVKAAIGPDAWRRRRQRRRAGDRRDLSQRGLRACASAGVTSRSALPRRREKGEVALPVDQIVFKEIQFIGSLAIQSFRYPAMLSMVERGRWSRKKLITETIPIEKAFGVLEQMSKFENAGISVINQF